MAIPTGGPGARGRRNDYGWTRIAPRPPAPPPSAGWINDIFTAKFEFEESSFTLIPDWFEKASSGTDAQIKCFDGRGAITGKLVIVPPEGRDITHRGVEITFTAAASALPDPNFFRVGWT